jgi:hypothetical protein
LFRRILALEEPAGSLVLYPLSRKRLDAIV